MKHLFLFKGNLLVIFWIFINILVVSCEPKKYAECSKMITVANEITKQTQAIAKNSSDRDQDLKNWVEASELMKEAASNIKNLELKDQQLIEYQSGLVNIYLVESQATYDAVKARETRNLEALQSAREEVNNIVETREALVQNINNYCIDKS